MRLLKRPNLSVRFPMRLENPQKPRHHPAKKQKKRAQAKLKKTIVKPDNGVLSRDPFYLINNKGGNRLEQARGSGTYKTQGLCIHFPAGRLLQCCLHNSLYQHKTVESPGAYKNLRQKGKRGLLRDNI